jgi:hypothetical protein
MKNIQIVTYLDGTLRIFNINRGFVNVGIIQGLRLARSMIVAFANAYN